MKIKYIHGTLFYDENENILSIEGTQSNRNTVLVNYIYLKDSKGWIEINGSKYIKLIKDKNGEWINFENQRRILEQRVDFSESTVYPFLQLVQTQSIYRKTDPLAVINDWKKLRDDSYILDSAFQLLKIQDSEYSSIGMIGSFQVGVSNEKSDIDLIFCLSKKRNYEIFLRIQEVINEGNQLFGKGERNRVNPLRFFHKGYEFCIHFSLPDDLINEFYIAEHSKGEKTLQTHTIKSIEYSIYCPTVLITEANQYLILYHGADRGIFKVGETLVVEGERFDNKIVVGKYERNLE